MLSYATHALVTVLLTALGQQAVCLTPTVSIHTDAAGYEGITRCTRKLLNHPVFPVRSGGKAVVYSLGTEGHKPATHKRIEQLLFSSITSLRRVEASLPVFVLGHNLGNSTIVANMGRVPMLEYIDIAAALPPWVDLVRKPSDPAGGQWRFALLKLAVPFILRNWRVVLSVDVDTFFIRSPASILENAAQHAPAYRNYGGTYRMELAVRQLTHGWSWPRIMPGTIGMKGNSGVLLFAPSHHIQFSASIVCLTHAYKDIACGDQSIWRWAAPLGSDAKGMCAKNAVGHNTTERCGTDLLATSSNKSMIESFCAAITGIPETPWYELPQYSHLMGPWNGVAGKLLSTAHRPALHDPVVLHRCCVKRNQPEERRFEEELLAEGKRKYGLGDM